MIWTACYSLLESFAIVNVTRKFTAFSLVSECRFELFTEKIPINMVALQQRQLTGATVQVATATKLQEMLIGRLPLKKRQRFQANDQVGKMDIIKKITQFSIRWRF